ncbi:hypothetical protein PC41400_00385 [Paenibacillus chitinolyticus]|uniref:Uncharacterized protein n=1 Tax=Paenibacillus chitinolyticus TaxID=79263 RepID=A0A410WPA4_9BACL|nr:hypothetical protein PC41400_00385 [Paenibacillus chitinolyticus]
MCAEKRSGTGNYRIGIIGKSLRSWQPGIGFNESPSESTAGACPRSTALAAAYGGPTLMKEDYR